MKNELKNVLAVLLAALLSFGALGAAFALPAEETEPAAGSADAAFPTDAASPTDATPTDALSAARHEAGYAYAVSGGQAVILAADASVTGDVTVPSTLGGAPVGAIGIGAFRGKTGLSSVTLPDSVSLIDEWAFAGCINLRRVSFGAAQQPFPENAFADCVSLTELTFAENAEGFLTSSDGVVFTADMTELVYAPRSLSGDYTVPAAVRRVCPFAFAGCALLRSVTMPAPLSSIGASAFRGCTALAAVDFTGAAQIGADAFADTAFAEAAGDGELYLGDNLIRAARLSLPAATPTDAALSPTDAAATLTDTTPTEAAIPAYRVRQGTVSVACGAFASLPWLEEIILPDSVAVLTDGAFAGLPALKKVNIPTAVVYGGSAFDPDPGLCAHEKTVVRYADPAVCTRPRFTGCVYCADCAELLRVGDVLPAAGHRFRALRQEADLDLGEVVVLTECTVCGETRRVPLSEYNRPFETTSRAYADGDFIIATEGALASDLLAGCPADALVLNAEDAALSPAQQVGSGMTVLFPSSRRFTVVIFGDADGDGRITAADARLALRISVRLEDPLVWRDKAAHVIFDGRSAVTSADARMILRASVQLEDATAFGRAATPATPTDATPTDATPTDATPAEEPQTDATPTDAEPEIPTGDYICRWTGGVYLREDHAYGADPLKIIRNGETVTVTEIFTDRSGASPVVWGKITYDGVTGWSMLKYYEAAQPAGVEE